MDGAQAYGKLNYSRECFYKFISYLEKITQEVLRPHNLVIFGNKIMQECRHQMLQSHALRGLFKNTVVANVDYLIDLDSDFLLIYTYFINIFIRMRGKDYCKRYIGDVGLSLTKNLRTTLAVKSDNKNYGGGDEANDDNQDNIDFDTQQEHFYQLKSMDMHYAMQSSLNKDISFELNDDSSDDDDNYDDELDEGQYYFEEDDYN